MHQTSDLLQQQTLQSIIRVIWPAPSLRCLSMTFRQKAPVNIRRNSAGLPNPIGGCSRLPGVALELSFTHNLKQTSLQPPGVFDIAMGITIMTPWWSQLRYGNVRQEFKTKRDTTRYNKIYQWRSHRFWAFFAKSGSSLCCQCLVHLSFQTQRIQKRLGLRIQLPPTVLAWNSGMKWSEAIKQKLDERGWKRYTVEHPQNRARKIVWMNSIEFYCISYHHFMYYIYI